MVGTRRTPISCVCLLLLTASVSGAQPNDPLQDNAHYLFPAIEAWTTPLPAPAVAEAALDARHLYVTLADGRLLALVRETGALAWTAEVDAVGTPHPAAGAVLAPTRDGIVALDAATGAVRWTTPFMGAPLAALTIEAGLVAGMSADGRVTALDAASGVLAWSRDLGYPASSRVLAGADGRFHAAFEDRVVALAAPSGGVLWERALPGPFAPPALEGSRLTVGSGAHALFALDAASGALDWRWQTGGDVVGSAVSAGHVYVVALDNRLRALARGSGNQRWQQLLATRPAHPPIMVGGAVLVSGVAPEVAAFDAVTGQPLGLYTAPAELRGPVLVDPSPRAFEVSLALVTRANVAIGLRSTGLEPAEPPLQPLAELPGRRLAR